MIDMKNPNVLVALAYLKTNDNPLYVFSRYILYALRTAPKLSLRADELRERLDKVFGLPMPQQMINTCARLLSKEGAIRILPDGGGYAANNEQFNVNEFEESIRRLREQEEIVLDKLAKFVEDKYGIRWTREEAKDNLSRFLDEEGNGTRLFINEPLEMDVKRVSPSWYVGRYITSVQQAGDSLEKKYLEEIVNGMMIYEGVYQTNDYVQDKNQKFKGTTFYFDTKLILRILGYSWEAQVTSARELVTLITKEYGGKVGLFPQTLTEVKKALFRAGENPKGIVDFELQTYAKLNPTGASLMCEASTAVQARLASEFGIRLAPDIDWDSKKAKENTIAIEEITDFIQGKHEHWRRGTIEYDVEIINQINILRNGDYSARFGGQKKLPVFITTNASLVYTFKDYVTDCLERDATTKWRTQALPIITDNMILFRLWTPVANRYSKLPALTLARCAYAAQNPSTQYFAELKKRTLEYQNEKGVDLIDLSEVRRQQLEDILVTRTEGDADQLTPDLVATSVDELIKMQNISLHEKVENLTGRVETGEQRIAELDSGIVRLLSKPHINKLGALRIPIWIAKVWWLIATGILFFITNYLVEQLGQNIAIPYAVAALPTIAHIILCAADKIFDRKDLHSFITKWAVQYAWRRYADGIIAELEEEYRGYKDAVLQYCRNNTRVFKKYEKYCSYDG